MSIWNSSLLPRMESETIMRQFNQSKVLITGGLGFIGSNLAIRLVNLGAQVTLIDSLIPEYGGNLFNVDNIKNQVKINISDVRDHHSMRYLIQDHEYLFNLAGQTSHLDSMQNPFIDLEINCTAQLAILEACKLYNPSIKVIFSSTRQLYGKPDYLPVDEKHLLRPVDVNGINKMAGEWYHILYHNVYGIRTCVLRLTNTYGPRMRIKDARQTFLGIWIRRLLEGDTFEVWGGEQRRDFNYIDDVVDAFLAAASQDAANGKIINLGNSEVHTLREVAEMMTCIFPHGRYIINEYPEERKKIDIGDYFSAIGFAKEIMGWEPKVSLQHGLESTIAYYKNNLKHYI
jgi:UDP-glucose 4-epimerase